MDQELNLGPLQWQVGSYPLCHQGSPMRFLLIKKNFKVALTMFLLQVGERIDHSET